MIILIKLKKKRDQNYNNKNSSKPKNYKKIGNLKVIYINLVV